MRTQQKAPSAGAGWRSSASACSSPSLIIVRRGVRAGDGPLPDREVRRQGARGDRRAGDVSARKSTTKPADGNQEHVPDGTPINYPDAPPAFGEH